MMVLQFRVSTDAVIMNRLLLSMKNAQELSEYSKMTSAEVKHLIENFEIKVLFWRGFELNLGYMKEPQII